MVALQAITNSGMETVLEEGSVSEFKRPCGASYSVPTTRAMMKRASCGTA